MSSAAAALELRGIDKRFGAVRANRNIDLSIAPGTIHGVIGENGAGKSTLMSIIYGFYEADAGTILMDGQTVDIRSSADAIKSGIGMVHQHFMLVERFTVLENVVLGAESGFLLAPSMRQARETLLKLEREFGLQVDPEAKISDLPVGLQQRVEIVKALYRGAKVLILDEPTSVLTPQETDQLFEILKSLKAQGVTIVLITHKLREIMAITDKVSVMRAGEMVSHRETTLTDKEELAELMVGRKIHQPTDKSTATSGHEILAVEHLDVIDAQGVKRVDDLNFTIRRGEILGVAGVSGNGQSELLDALAGISGVAKGRIRIDATEIGPERPIDPSRLREMGLAHIPEDRLRRGLVSQFHAAESAILGYHSLSNYNHGVLLDRGAIRADCEALMTDYDVRPPDSDLKSANFSGGNQQKIVVGRELRQAPKVLLVGQPTRGVDIGAIEFIHRQILAMRAAGSAILLVSVELDEIMALSDRIVVMFEGRIVGEMLATEANEKILGLMMANAHEPTES